MIIWDVSTYNNVSIDGNKSVISIEPSKFIEDEDKESHIPKQTKNSHSTKNILGGVEKDSRLAIRFKRS